MRTVENSLNYTSTHRVLSSTDRMSRIWVEKIELDLQIYLSGDNNNSSNNNTKNTSNNTVLLYNNSELNKK